MDYSKLMEQAAAYTQKFVDAAMPVAQKAYEIGLLTIQIDALSVIVPAILCVCILPYLFYRIFKWDAIDKNTEIINRGLPSAFIGVPILGIALHQLTIILNVWIWVKLFKPELWLAKQAIEKVLEVAK